MGTRFGQFGSPVSLDIRSVTYFRERVRENRISAGGIGSGESEAMPMSCHGSSAWGTSGRTATPEVGQGLVYGLALEVVRLALDKISRRAGP